MVSELPEHLAKRAEGSVTAPLKDFSVNDDATVLSVCGQTMFVLDESANLALAKYLRVPSSYLNSLTPEFRATLLRYEFDRRADSETVLESLDGEIMSIHQPSQIMLPLSRVAEVVTKVLHPHDIVRRIVSDDQRFHLDITTTQHVVDFPTPAGVGDITEGGVRILSYPYQSKPPSVSTYIERLVCSNGMCTAEKTGQINLKGCTVDEVIASMEEAAEDVLSQLDNHLNRYAETRSMLVPGSPQAFAAQLAREAGVNRKILDSVLDIVNQLPPPVTVWDINQAFTNVANYVEKYSTMNRLQNLGGTLAFFAEEAVHRCGTCERLL